MIGRRIYRNGVWYSGRRWLSSFTTRYSSSPAPVSSPLPMISGKKHSLQVFVQCATTSSGMVYDKYLNMRNLCSFSSQAVGIVDVPLAQTGEGIAECELLKWFVQEGDQVEEFQPLCEVQSDKATIEITSRYNGKVAQILYVPGDIVKVGETLLKMFSEYTEISTPISADLDKIKSAGSDTLDSDTSDSDTSDSDTSDSDTCESSNQSSVLKTRNTGGVLSTPAVRSLAKQYGINIKDVHGTGNDGRVLKGDVLNYAVHEGIVKPPSSAFSTSEQFLRRNGEDSYASAADGSDYVDKRVPIRGFQRTMVKMMTMAAKVPHFHYVEEVNCDALVELKMAFQNENSDPHVKHTFLPSLIKSLSMALRKYPLVNSCFDEESQEIILKGSQNIGIAMATPHGLVVPKIKKVQSLSILEITKELSRLQQLASDNKLTPEDISGGTITLSNIGAIGGKFGSPLLNLPEVAIIAIGRIQKVPHFSDDGNVYPMSVMTVNIGADHRVLDGATVARFSNEWKLYIEKPELLMLHMR